MIGVAGRVVSSAFRRRKADHLEARIGAHSSTKG